MGDRVWAWVEVLWPAGLPDPFDRGAVRAWRDRLPDDGHSASVGAFLDAVEAAIDYCDDDRQFDAETGWVRLADGEVNYGTSWFDAEAGLFAACEELGVAYRAGDDGSVEWGPSLTEWAPGMAGRQERPTVNGEPALTARALDSLAALHPDPARCVEAVRAWLAGPDLAEVRRAVMPTVESPGPAA